MAMSGPTALADGRHPVLTNRGVLSPGRSRSDLSPPSRARLDRPAYRLAAPDVPFGTLLYRLAVRLRHAPSAAHAAQRVADIVPDRRATPLSRPAGGPGRRRA